MVALVLGACTDPGGAPVVVEGEFVPGAVTGTGDILFEAPATALVSVRYGPVDGPVRRSEAVPAGVGAIRLSGLAAGRVHEFEVIAETWRPVGKDRFQAEIPEASDAPDIEPPPETTTPEDLTCGPGRVLFTWASGPVSGVAMVDRNGDIVWSLLTPDPDQLVYRARLARDGRSVLWATADRDVVMGHTGHLYRDTPDGLVHAETETLDPHHDFVELPALDGVPQYAWLAWYATQPSDGATLTRLLTDRIYVAPEGGTRDDALRVFATLGDFTRGAYAKPVEGLNAYPGFDEFAGGASLAWNERDGEFLLMWRWVDTLLRIDDSTADVLEQWGGRYSTLPGHDSFARASFSDVTLAEDGGDDRILVFDNRHEGASSRLVEYRFDEARFEQTWSLEADYWEAGVGDVRSMPGCDHLLVTWPAAHRIVEIDREGNTVWSITVDGDISRAEFLPDP